MDNFLNLCDQVAYWAGNLSAPLGIIEIFYPRKADQLEQWIDNLEDKFRANGDNFTQSNFYQISFSISIPVWIYLIYYRIAIWSPVLAPRDFGAFFWFCITVILLPSFLGIALYFLEWLIRFLNKITDGSAIGGIGVIFLIVSVIADNLDKVLSAF